MPTKKITALAMLSALAFIAMAATRGLPPIVPMPPLRYDPKDVVITIGGFLYGPLAAFAVTLVVSVVEMLTVSTTGPIGLLMNVVSGSAFACTAALVYKYQRSLRGAVMGLAAAWLLTALVMVLWNYLMTPVFMKVPRAAVMDMLLPVFLPFNLLKGGLNAAFTMLLYKPVKAALLASRMIPPAEQGVKGKFNWGIVIVSVFAIGTCLLWALVLQGRL